MAIAATTRSKPSGEWLRATFPSPLLRPSPKGSTRRAPEILSSSSISDEHSPPNPSAGWSGSRRPEPVFLRLEYPLPAIWGGCNWRKLPAATASTSMCMRSIARSCSSFFQSADRTSSRLRPCIRPASTRAMYRQADRHWGLAWVGWLDSVASQASCSIWSGKWPTKWIGTGPSLSPGTSKPATEGRNVAAGV
jgi:hypothetical protein